MQRLFRPRGRKLRPPGEFVQMLEQAIPSIRVDKSRGAASTPRITIDAELDRFEFVERAIRNLKSRE